MSVFLLLLNTILAMLAAAGILACGRLRSRPAYLVGLYVLSYAQIVIILQLAGLFSAISPIMVFFLQVTSTTISMLVWNRMGRPEIFGPFSDIDVRRLHARDLIVSALKSARLPGLLLIFLVLGVAIAYARSAQLILALPPSNADSLTYHLSRVGYWLQYKSLYPWPTANLRQTTFPINTELGFLWTILWRRTDQLAAFIQWIAVPVIIIGIYGLARLIGYTRWQSALTGLLWATLPQVQVQSSTTQNDLITTSFWVAALYFGMLGLHSRNRFSAYISGVAFGLALGAKSTSLLVLPGMCLALFGLILLWRKKVGIQGSLIRLAAAGLLGFLLFGSYIYIQNSIVFGAALGPQAAKGAVIHLKTDVDTQAAILTDAMRLRDNLGRYVYQLVDFSPLPFDLASKINPLKARVFSFAFQWMRVPVQNPGTILRSTFDLDYINRLDEDASWFGPMMLFLIPAILYQTYRAIRGKDAQRLVLAVLAISFLVVESAAQPWTPAKGRYFNIPVALAFPLMACCLNTYSPWRLALSSFLALLGLTVLFSFMILQIQIQPIDILSTARLAPAWLDEYKYRMISENVPAYASIGVENTGGFRDYPLFGESFTRHVTLAIPAEAAIVPHMDTRRFVQDFQNSDYLLTQDGGSPAIADLANREYDLLSDDGGSALWIRKGEHPVGECDGGKWPFSDFFQSPEDMICPQFPIVPGYIGRDPDRSVSRIRFLNNGDFFPLVGIRPESMASFGLLVKEAAAYSFSVDVGAPSNAGKGTLKLILSETDSEPQVFSAPFTDRQTLNITIPLVQGIYKMEIGLQPGSDWPARINKIQVTRLERQTQIISP